MSSGLKKDVDRLVQRLEREHGCIVRRTGKRHYRVTKPGVASITMTGTPSDRMVMRRIARDCRVYLGIDLGDVKS